MMGNSEQPVDFSMSLGCQSEPEKPEENHTREQENTAQK